MTADRYDLAPVATLSGTEVAEELLRWADGWDSGEDSDESPEAVAYVAAVARRGAELLTTTTTYTKRADPDTR